MRDDLPEIVSLWLTKRTVAEGECLLWAGDLAGPKRDQPRARIGSKRPVNVRRVVWQWAHPLRTLRPGNFVSSTCKNPKCVNPEHLVQCDRSAAYVGSRKSLATRARIAQTQRRRLSKLTPADVQLIRTSPLKGEDMAKLLGVSKSCVNKIRHGDYWRDLAGSPFSGLGMRA